MFEKFEKVCRNIRAGTPPQYKWQWDDRFHVALVAFEKKDMEAIFAVLLAEFTEQWDSRTIAKSSKQVRELVKKLFDIKPGQIIFAADESIHSVLLGAWWPWANGSIISLRIGMFPMGKEPIDQAATKKCLVEWFGIETQ